MTLREINTENWITAIKLKVKKEQESFVASNAISIAQSKFEPYLECYGIYIKEKMVGFSALGINPKDKTLWIARHMIDENYQGQGYGKAGLKAVIEFMKEKFNQMEIFLDVEENNEIATTLYLKAGFKPTGEKHGNSPIFKLNLSQYSNEY
ncbi:MAG: GNAT family N-acetyltransferase [Candidatus Heimdallarchaeota archaeon]|nr:GNAT family N-acetyltransferase [Candidatus Heimdallarchaeota archaeon]